MAAQTAIVVVTHMYADDVGPYDSFGKHLVRMGPLARACSNATVRLYDYLLREEVACSLRFIDGSAPVVGMNVFHRIEKQLNVDPSLSAVFERDDIKKRAIMFYGKTCGWRRHTWYEVFEKAVGACAGPPPRVAGVLFMDENVVLRVSTMDALMGAVRGHAAASDGSVLVLGDDHRGGADDGAHPADEPGLCDAETEIAPCASLHHPIAFVAPVSAMQRMRRVLASAPNRDMVLHRLREALVWKRACPPCFWDMDEYLADKRDEHDHDDIEQAILCVQDRARAAAPPVPRWAPVVHQIWLGREMPRLYKQYHAELCALHARVRMWGNEHLHALRRTLRNLPLCTSYAMASDAARLEILYENGGVYADSDFRFVRNMEPLLEGQIFFCKEYFLDHTSIANGWIGCRPRNLFMLKLLSHWARSICRDGEYVYTLSSGPVHVAKLHASIEHLVDMSRRSRVCRTVPSSLLYSKERDQIQARPDECFGRHMYGSSWWA